MNPEFVCPYCGNIVTITECINEKLLTREYSEYPHKCTKCEHISILSTELRYVVRPADCLNGGNHNWVTSKGLRDMNFQCSNCGKLQTPTQEELIELHGAENLLQDLRRTLIKHLNGNRIGLILSKEDALLFKLCNLEIPKTILDLPVEIGDRTAYKTKVEYADNDDVIFFVL